MALLRSKGRRVEATKGILAFCMKIGLWDNLGMLQIIDNIGILRFNIFPMRPSVIIHIYTDIYIYIYIHRIYNRAQLFIFQPSKRLPRCGNT